MQSQIHENANKTTSLKKHSQVIFSPANNEGVPL
jgi:hypothetical protein